MKTENQDKFRTTILIIYEIITFFHFVNPLLIFYDSIYPVNPLITILIGYVFSGSFFFVISIYILYRKNSSIFLISGFIGWLMTGYLVFNYFDNIQSMTLNLWLFSLWLFTGVFLLFLQFNREKLGLTSLKSRTASEQIVSTLKEKIYIIIPISGPIVILFTIVALTLLTSGLSRSLSFLILFIPFSISTILLNDKNTIRISLFHFAGYSALLIDTVISLNYNWIPALWNADDLVPLLGLHYSIHDLIFTVLWPIFGTILLLLCFSRIISHLYLKYKAFTMRKYENTYVQIQDNYRLSSKKLMSRVLYVVLMSFGMIRFLISLNLYSPEIIASNWQSFYHDLPDKYLLFNSPLLVLPIIVAISSIGWILEDIGLMHYKYDGKKNFFEFEPIHYRYNSFLKGFAGISTIFFIFSYIIEGLLLPYNSISYINQYLIFNLMMGFLSAAAMLPGYFIYNRLNKDHLIKNLQKLTDLFEIKSKEM